MCDCITWHHPLWRVIGKRVCVKPGIVWSIFTALRDGDAVLTVLSPHDRALTLAEGLGWKPMQVKLVLAALEQSHVIDARGQVSDAFSDTESFKTSEFDELIDDDERRRARSDTNRRYYLRRTGKLPARRRANEAEIKTSVVSESDDAFLEEREQDDLFLSSDVRARDPVDNRKLGGYGTQEEAAKVARKQRWITNTLEFARDHISITEVAALQAAAMNDPLPKWAQQKLDALSSLRDELRNGPPKQRSLIMPIAGTAGRQTRPARHQSDRRTA